MNSPQFPAPNIAEAIAAKIAANPPDARIHFGFKKNPEEDWVTKHQEPLRAAQRIVDDHMASLDLAPLLAHAAADEVGAHMLDELRARVRVSKDAPIQDVIQAILRGQWSRKVMMMCPMHRPIHPWVHLAKMATLRTNPWMGYDQEVNPFTLVRGRNALADRFLKSEAEWSYWVDDDTIPPFGNPGIFYTQFGAHPSYCPPPFMGLNAIDKLRSRGKTIISGIVGARDHTRRLMIQPELKPNGHGDKDFAEALKKSGPRDEVKQVTFVGTGCVMVHRSVYLDIMKRFPQFGAEGQPFNFFGHDSVGVTEGEDSAFSKMAQEAGHSCWIDLAVWCAHTGQHSYFPQPPK